VASNLKFRKTPKRLKTRKRQPPQGRRIKPKTVVGQETTRTMVTAEKNQEEPNAPTEM